MAFAHAASYLHHHGANVVPKHLFALLAQYRLKTLGLLPFLQEENAFQCLSFILGCYFGYQTVFHSVLAVESGRVVPKTQDQKSQKRTRQAASCLAPSQLHVSPVLAPLASLGVELAEDGGQEQNLRAEALEKANFVLRPTWGLSLFTEVKNSFWDCSLRKSLQ